MEASKKNQESNLEALTWDFHAREHFSHSTLQIAFHHPSDPELHEKFLCLKADADLGLSYAQFEVGEYYRLGRGISPSIKNAFHYYVLASRQGNINSIITLGQLYKEGIGLDQSYEKAFALFNLAARKGDSRGQFIVGQCYEEGIGTQPSTDNAIYYYQLSAKNGNYPAAYLHLARIYLNGINVTPSKELADKYFQQFLTIHRHLADDGYTDSMVWIGNRYQLGEGVETNLEIAFNYYKKAADQSNGWGLYRLGQCFEKGWGVKQSIEKAIYYYKKADEYGSDYAIINLALCLEYTEQYEESFNLWKVISQGQFSKQDRAHAEFFLAYFFEIGRGVKQSNKNALYYYHKSSTNGYKRSSRFIAHAYLHGLLGLNQSFENARIYFNLSGYNFDYCKFITEGQVKIFLGCDEQKKHRSLLGRVSYVEQINSQKVKLSALGILGIQNRPLE